MILTADTARPSEKAGSDSPPLLELNNVEVVFNDVILPLLHQLACLLHLRFATQSGEVIERHDLRPNEAPFDILMNRATCLRRSGSASDRPGTDFVLTHCKE